MTNELTGKRIVVTGPTGQVALPVTLALAEHNEVIGLARFRDAAARAPARGGRRHLHRDQPRGRRLLRRCPTDVDYVLNLAVVKSNRWEIDLAANAEAAGLLMAHCRNATAMLHCSSTGVYEPAGLHQLAETDALGDNHRVIMETYSIAKIAAEAVVRTCARLYDLPTTIARLNVPYGDNGGWPAFHLAMIEAGQPVPVHPDRPNRFNPIHEDDIIRMVPALLDVASVPATIVNWGGTEAADLEEWCAYLGELVGRRPRSWRPTPPSAASPSTPRRWSSSSAAPRSPGATASAAWSTPAPPRTRRGYETPARSSSRGWRGARRGRRGARRGRPSTIGASSAGVAPCRITLSAPAANWSSTRCAHTAGDPTAAAAIHSSGNSVAMCSSCSVVPIASIAPGIDATTSSARKRASTSGSQWFTPHEQVAVALEVGAEPADGLLQLEVVGDVVADGAEHAPHPHARRVAPGPLGAAPHRRDRARQRVVGEVGVQHDAVDVPAGAFERPLGERAEDHGDVLGEARVLVQDGVRAGGAVVAHHHLAVPQPPVDPDRVLDLRVRDAGQVDDVEQEVEAAAEPEREAAAGEAVHRRRHRGGGEQVARVVVRGRGRDAEVLGDRADRARQHARVLHVEALGDERAAEPDRLAVARLGDRVVRACRCGPGSA